MPNVSFVIPNQCNDGHNSCAPLFNYVRQYDLWLQNNLNAYKQWAVNNNSLLIVTYDEDDFTPTNKIATVFAGAYVAQGTYTQTINHYNVLRTIEEANRLTTHAGAAASVARIDYCWTQFPGSRNVDSYYLQNVEKNSVKNILVYPNRCNVIVEFCNSRMKPLCNCGLLTLSVNLFTRKISVFKQTWFENLHE